MKHIKKATEPASLATWRNSWMYDANGSIVSEPINCTYDDFTAQVQRDVKTSLLREQGNLCCYTGIRITDARSHVEHFYPQHLCRKHEDVDYANMMAAYPRDGCEFGARIKDKLFSPNLVNPCDPNCATHFKYLPDGTVEATTQQGQATIDMLQLNHRELKRMRLTAIRKAFAERNKKQKSDAKVKQIAANYESTNNPFCFVIAQVAPLILTKRQRNKKKKKHAQSQAKKDKKGKKK